MHQIPLKFPLFTNYHYHKLEEKVRNWIQEKFAEENNTRQATDEPLREVIKNDDYFFRQFAINKGEFDNFDIEKKKELVKKRYRDLTKDFHPDLASEKEKLEAEILMKDLNETYEYFCKKYGFK